MRKVFAAVLLLLLALPAGSQQGIDAIGMRRVAQLHITPQAVTVVRGGPAVQFAATVLDQAGQEIRGQDAAGNMVPSVRVRWISTNPSVMTIDSLGRGTPVGTGTARVTAEVVGQYITTGWRKPTDPAGRLRMPPIAFDSSGQTFTACAYIWDGMTVVGAGSMPECPLINLGQAQPHHSGLGTLYAFAWSPPLRPEEWVRPVLAVVQP